jgi:ABC-type lipoprotein export system ATPase subunit
MAFSFRGDRIKELRRVPASSLRDNPRNWRTHSEAQLAALRQMLERLGFAGAELVRERDDGELELIDGHARKSIMGDEVIPVLVTDLTPEESDLLLATFDPIGAMAGADQDKLADLLKDLEIDGSLKTMLDDLAGLSPESEPKPVTLDLSPRYAVMVQVPDESTQKQLMQQADAAGFDNAAIVTGFAPPKPVEVIVPPAAGTIRITRETAVNRSIRVRQVEGMFDLPASDRVRRQWDYKLELPETWSIGAIIGPSGSGKTTLAREWFGDRVIAGWPWAADTAIVDGFPAALSIQEVTGLLSSVGFSSPPDWTKPYHVLSNGEKFRVDVARTLAERPELAVIDEFTSVVDRTVAKIGSAAVAKAVRQSGRRLVAVSCHSDIIDWLCPDWVLDVETGELARRSLRRPPIRLDLRRVGRGEWAKFAHYHYLNHDIHKAAACFVATVDGRSAAFIGVMHMAHPTHSRWRASRIVCHPDFQGVGIGNALTERIAAAYSATGKEFLINTSHPAMIASLAKSPVWRCSRAYAVSEPSAGASDGSRLYSDQRATCGFIFTGQPDRDAAKALGILKA